MESKEKFKHISYGFFFIILVYLYSLIHEFIHYMILRNFGYTGIAFKINLLMLKVIPPDALYTNPTHLFAVAIGPYIFDIFLLLILLTLYIRNKKQYIAMLAFFPLIDILINLLGGIIKLFVKISEPNDFWYIFVISKINILLLFYNMFIIAFTILSSIIFIPLIVKYVRSYYSSLYRKTSKKSI